MNKDSFFRYIENDCTCGQDRLDKAVHAGLYRAKNDRIDTKKLLTLAAAGVFTFAMCVAINVTPFTTVVEGYYRNRQKTMPGSSEALNGYIKDIAANLEKHLGGK